MPSKRLKDRMDGYDKKAEEDEVWRATVTPGQVVTLRHQVPESTCPSDWHKGVVGSDGVCRVMLPSGRVYEPSPCTNPKCQRLPRPVTSEELQTLEARNRGDVP